MIQKAIEKINTEIQMSPNDTYRAVIGEYIIDHIITDEDAAKVLDEKKTLGRALEEVVSKAKKQARGSKAFIEDSVVFGWAMKYFGFEGEFEGEDSPNPQTAAEKPKEKPAEKGIVLNLEDFFV